jgi:hypothetical protein
MTNEARYYKADIQLCFHTGWALLGPWLKVRYRDAIRGTADIGHALIFDAASYNAVLCAGLISSRSS